MSWLEELNTLLATLSPITPPEVAIMQRRLLELFYEQRGYLNSKPTEFLEELLHRSDDLRRHETFTVRAGAEINHAACVMILEQRRGKGINGKGIKP